ncbi:MULTISPECIES: bh protein [Bacillaceae]|uniref:bh protein n=1 Tax=Bacillaceae TaxID=186817 RepID=UPI001E312255|nr:MULTISPECIES: bh protein [Bacillaceae]MCE4051617.1 bh protein [Bacillus sp. Au-Bac7]MCM3029671.1 bh protein [Niallia sp. MER 6]MDL0437697.1 bh protein [Niallia sp. SS-2023]UPO87195.1 bh protein [Niallia sp. Man26]
MKRSVMEANLFCTHCNNESLHDVVYINEEITSVKCHSCLYEAGMKVNIMREFYKELFEHIATKPSRITEEYKQDLSRFIARLPIRVISKPYRFMRYLNESRKVMKYYKKC